MPKNLLNGLPFPPLLILDQDAPIREEQIRKLFESGRENNGISILVRNESGHQDRGGYYFHIKKNSNKVKEYFLYDFEKSKVSSLHESDLILLINHCSGREFSPKSYSVCQNEINLRNDLQ